MRLLVIIAMFLALFGVYMQPANAEPTIILDDGGVSTDKYRRILDTANKVPDFGGQWVLDNYSRIERDPENPNVWLPLTTRKLHPARISRDREVNFDLDAPICIVGSDPLSLRWIEENLDGLVMIKARCWLVQARDFRDFSAVSQRLQGRVLLLPVDGDEIADYFQIANYPVVIDQRYISQ